MKITPSHVTASSILTPVNLILGVLIVVAALAIYFPLRDGRRLNRDLTESRYRLAELEVLQPLFIELTSAQRQDAWTTIPSPSLAILTQEDVMGVPALFTSMASECGMEVKTVRPRVVLSGIDKKRQLHVEVQMTGSYDRFRDFLAALAGLPAMERIEQVDLRREEMHEAFGLSLYLALDQR